MDLIDNRPVLDATKEDLRAACHAYLQPAVPQVKEEEDSDVAPHPPARGPPAVVTTAEAGRHSPFGTLRTLVLCNAVRCFGAEAVNELGHGTPSAAGMPYVPRGRSGGGLCPPPGAAGGEFEKKGRK